MPLDVSVPLKRLPVGEAFFLCGGAVGVGSEGIDVGGGAARVVEGQGIDINGDGFVVVPGWWCT